MRREIFIRLILICLALIHPPGFATQLRCEQQFSRSGSLVSIPSVDLPELNEVRAILKRRWPKKLLVSSPDTIRMIRFLESSGAIHHPAEYLDALFWLGHGRLLPGSLLVRAIEWPQNRQRLAQFMSREWRPDLAHMPQRQEAFREILKARIFSHGEPRGLYRPTESEEDLLEFALPLQRIYPGRFNTFLEDLVFGLSMIAQTRFAISWMEQVPRHTYAKMMREGLRRRLGLSWQLAQDVGVLSRFDPRSPTDYRSSVILYSNTPIDGAIRYFGGIYYKELKALPYDNPTFDEKFQWQIDGKTYSAHLRYSALSQRDLVPKNEAGPDFSAFLRDQKLAGAILIARTLTNHAPILAGIYENFYKRLGYRKVMSQKISNQETIERFYELVATGQLDYLLREGHTEFSSDHLLSLGGSTQLTLLEKEGAELGPNQAVWIFQSIPGTEHMSPNSNLTLSSLGEALRSRQQDQAQFLYLDSGCASISHLPRLISQTAASGFLPIGAKDEQDTFTGRPGTAIYEFLSQLLKGGDFAVMRRGVRASENGFVFPDQGEQYISSESRLNIKPFQLEIDRNFQPLTRSKD